MIEMVADAEATLSVKRPVNFGVAFGVTAYVQDIPHFDALCARYHTSAPADGSYVERGGCPKNASSFKTERSDMVFGPCFESWSKYHNASDGRVRLHFRALVSECPKFFLAVPNFS